MATAFIALGASKLVCRKPVYWSLAEEFLGTSLTSKPEGATLPAHLENTNGNSP